MKRSISIITTERLFLRQIDETDADSIVMMRSEKDVYQYFLNPVKLTIEDHKKWFRDCYSKNDERMDWIAVNDLDGSLVGVYGAKKSSDDEIELSYLTNRQMRGKGYASEAVNAVIKWCGDNWKNTVFSVSVHKDNAASLLFAKSIGFFEESSEGNFIILKMIREK